MRKKRYSGQLEMKLFQEKDNGTVLDPQGNATRSECATIIMRFIEKYEKNNI